MKSLFLLTPLLFLSSIVPAEPNPSADPILCGVPPKASDLVTNGIVTKVSQKTDSLVKEQSPLRRKIAGLTPQERNSLLSLLNNGTREELIAIKGIAETRANTILSSRPIFELEDLAMLRGFGPSLISRVLDHKSEALQ